MADLKVCALPIDIRWADRTDNLHTLSHAMLSVDPTTDLVALPELFTTAFVADEPLMRQLAETDDGLTMTTVRELAAKHRMALCGSFLARNAGGTEFYNRAFFVEPNGDTAFCDKRHLFGLSPESQLITPGRSPYICVRYRGWNIAVGVCYDLRFPVWCRNTLRHGSPAYDLMVFAANWPQARAHALRTLLCARAIENQAYTLCANRSGEDDYGQYDGLTLASDFGGNVIAESTTDTPVYTILDHSLLDRSRQKLTALADADHFSIDL